MATFSYKAKTREGESREGIIEASSRDAAINTLQRNSLIIVALDEKKTGINFSSFSRVSQKDVVIFSRQLATLFEARIPVVESLKTLIGETAKPQLRDVTAQILDDVAGGLAISQAMAKHPNVFSSFYINMVRSGEESGKLQEVFTYLADYLERSYYLMTKARNSTIYPAFVLVAFIGVIIVMLVAVVPRLVSIFEEMGQPVPFYTQIVIFISLSLRKFGIVVILLMAAGAVGLWRWMMTERGKHFMHHLQLKIPVFGQLYKKLYMARLTDNLKTLIAGGIPIIKALSISGDVVGNVVYERAIREAIESVKGGGSISSAFEKTPEIPPLVTHMIRIGETSGRLDFILERIAKYYQQEVESTVENLVALIEPTLIIFLGAGIGILVASIMVPLYNLVGSF